jgi:hypothetical protein
MGEEKCPCADVSRSGSRCTVDASADMMRQKYHCLPGGCSYTFAEKLLLMKSIRIALFCTLLLTGFSAGIGFANALGYMPAFADTPAQLMVPFWQNADKYFRARMPIFGNLLLLSLVVSLVSLRKHRRTPTFWLLATGLLFALCDLTVIFTENLPINLQLETWTVDTIPANYEAIREQVVHAFSKRSLFTILSFVSVLLGTYCWQEQEKPVTVRTR